MKKNIFKKWWFWLLIFFVICAVVVGLFFGLRDADTDRDDEYEISEKNKNPFLGKWYISTDEGICYIEFYKNDKCEYGNDTTSIKCEYEYDKNRITIDYLDDEDPIDQEYTVGSNYIKIGDKKIYKKRSKAEKELNESNSEKNNDINFYSNDGKYKLNETFKFDDLEITFSDKYSFTKVKNEYSDHNGKTVVKIPVTVKNLKNETHSLNMFYYNVYGSKGTRVETVGSYFTEDLEFAGDLRSGASYTKYLYFIYDGDGEYVIEFDNYSEKVELSMQIKK